MDIKSERVTYSRKATGRVLTQVTSHRCFTDRLTEAVRIERLSEPRFDNLIHTGVLEDA